MDVESTTVSEEDDTSTEADIVTGDVADVVTDVGVLEIVSDVVSTDHGVSDITTVDEVVGVKDSDEVSRTELLSVVAVVDMKDEVVGIIVELVSTTDDDVSMKNDVDSTGVEVIDDVDSATDIDVVGRTNDVSDDVNCVDVSVVDVDKNVDVVGDSSTLDEG